jgi:anti-anti-sigma regulatory factor
MGLERLAVPRARLGAPRGDMPRQWLLPVIVLACVAASVALPTLEYVRGCIRSDVWPASLIALHVISDGLIALAYVWIPLTLIAVWRRRNDIPFNWTLLCFAGFIVSCGATHVMGIVTTWRPLYWLAGEIKLLTGLISIATAALLTFRVYPQLLRIPSADALRRALERAEREAFAALRATADAEKAQAELAAANARLSELNTRLEVSIRELSTPVLEVHAGILLAPIIGAIDAERAQLLMEAISREVTARKAHTVLLDLTGVAMVDTAVANYLIKTAATVALLGARCAATGIQPSVARTVVELGVDLAMPTSGSLAQGLAQALAGRNTRR